MIILSSDIERFKRQLKEDPFNKEKAQNRMNEFKEQIVQDNILFKERADKIKQSALDQEILGKRRDKSLEANKEFLTARTQEVDLKTQLSAMPQSDPDYAALSAKVKLAMVERMEKEDILDEESNKLSNSSNTFYENVNREIKLPTLISFWATLLKIGSFLIGVGISLGIALLIHRLIKLILARAADYELPEEGSEIVLILLFALAEKFLVSRLERKVESNFDKWRILAELKYLGKIVHDTGF